MSPTDAGQAINSRVSPQVAYGVDPRGWSFFRRLSGVLQDGHTGRAGRRVVDTQATFTGLAATAPQSFTGLAPLGVSRTVVPAGTNLPDERAAGVLESGALRIFAERLRRGQS